jgi:hypothetical protein
MYTMFGIKVYIYYHRKREYDCQANVMKLPIDIDCFASFEMHLQSNYLQFCIQVYRTAFTQFVVLIHFRQPLIRNSLNRCKE